MNGAVEFARIFGAVLFANLLTVAFVYALHQFTRAERTGTEDGAGGHVGTVVMVLAFLLVAMIVGFAG